MTQLISDGYVIEDSSPAPDAARHEVGRACLHIRDSRIVKARGYGI